MNDLTPELWKRLEGIAKYRAELDIRYGYDKQAEADYDKLLKMGYCSFHESGPGGSVLVYTITPKGKQALETRNS